MDLGKVPTRSRIQLMKQPNPSFLCLPRNRISFLPQQLPAVASKLRIYLLYLSNGCVTFHSEEQTADDQRETTLTSKSAELKNPFRSSGGPASVSVFSNPFKEAEDAEKSSLEKHVKLAPKIEDVREINGRRICWNYRKGRCRFGSKCIYAHDSELLQKKEEPVNYEQSTVASQGFDDKKASQVTNKRPAFGSKTIPSKKSKGPVK